MCNQSKNCFLFNSFFISNSDKISYDTYKCLLKLLFNSYVYILFYLI